MRPGDLGWTFMRQAEIYTSEFGYAPVFEAYVARGLAPFLDGFDADRDGLWVAELDGRRAGAVALHHDAERAGWAKLRWYFVEAASRGHGIGTALIEHALAFARQARYEGVHLWTCSDLTAAARRYEKAGFRLAEEAPCPWKPEVVQQRYEVQTFMPPAPSATA